MSLCVPPLEIGRRGASFSAPRRPTTDEIFNGGRRNQGNRRTDWDTAVSFRFVTKTVHAFLDYPVALGLIAAPFMLGLGKANPAALWLSVATGAAAFVLTLLTDHKTGVFRVLPYWFHLAVDRTVGFVFAVAPFALGFTGLDAWYYWANAAALLIVTFVLNAPEGERNTLAVARG
jgi:hypothetical protein